MVDTTPGTAPWLASSFHRSVHVHMHPHSHEHMGTHTLKKGTNEWLTDPYLGRLNPRNPLFQKLREAREGKGGRMGLG